MEPQIWDSIHARLLQKTENLEHEVNFCALLRDALTTTKWEEISKLWYLWGVHIKYYPTYVSSLFIIKISSEKCYEDITLKLQKRKLAKKNNSIYIILFY